jgi:hypothetical protein
MSTDVKAPEIQQRDAATKFLMDPYLDWAEGEGIPIHQDFGFDLLALETAPWDRYEARGCFAHAHGRGDFMSCYVLEIPAGGKTRPTKHLYEAFFFTLSGHGSTVVWTPDGQKRTFEFPRPSSPSRSTANIRSSTARAASRRAFPAPTTRR